MTDIQLIIEKLPIDPPPPADEITISPISDEPTSINEQNWKDLNRFLSHELTNKVFCVNSDIFIDYFNKQFKFRIQNIVTRHYDEFDDLHEKLENLNLDGDNKFNRFHLITRHTKFVLNIKNDETVVEPAVQSKLSLIGGLDKTLKELLELMNLAFGHTKTMQGIQISRSVLLYGLAGCGKSLVCDVLAEQSRALIIKINASEIFSKYFGETEANLLNHFDMAFKNHPKPTIIIIEEIVNICAKENKEDSAKRIASAFLNVLDTVHQKKEGSRVFVVATTSNIENINPAVRRCGRFDLEIEIPVPNPNGREEILSKHLAHIQHSLTIEDVKWLANASHGFVGADLASLISKAAAHSINEAAINDDIPILKISDIHHVFGCVKPSAMREVLIECPNVKWSDIGGQTELKLQLKQAIEWPLTHPEKFIRLGINPPRGILMFGPPGCSKTMIAKALATESKVNFLSIKGPELFSMWVGESEKAVRDLFRKARQVAPAIIFFDEIDALGGERAGSGSSSVKERVLAQMLTEMDGVHALNNVTIVAATNRPDLIDKALMRPGRIDRIVYVKLPDAKTREDIFKIKMNKMPIDRDVSIDELVQQTDGYSGAEVQAVCQEAALKALEENFDVDSVRREHFFKALEIVTPRTSSELLKLYEDYTKKF